VRSIAILCLHASPSVCLCLSVRSHILKPNVQISRSFLYLLSVTVARSFSDNSAIHYVRPVMWMTSCFYHGDAMLALVFAVIVCMSVCVCPSVSHAGIVSKRLNVRSRKQRHVITQGLYRFMTPKGVYKTLVADWLTYVCKYFAAIFRRSIRRRATVLDYS